MTTREELARVLYEAPFGGFPVSEWPPPHPDDRAWWLTRADAVLAAGLPITDAQVAATARVFYESQVGNVGGLAGSIYRENWEQMARIALEAARDADVLAAGWRRE